MPNSNSTQYQPLAEACSGRSIFWVIRILGLFTLALQPTYAGEVVIRAPPSQIITPGSPGSWDDRWVIDGHVIMVQDTLKMWYLGISYYDTNVYHYKGIGYAYSVDTGKTWQKYAGNPVFISDSTSEWERTAGYTDGLWEATVIYEDNEYKMWYQAWDPFDCWNTLYATSPDGINWTRRNNGQPVVYSGYYEGGENQWDAHYAGVRSIERVGPLYYLFYEGGKPGGSISMGLAIGVNETTFTKVDTSKAVFTTVGTPDTLWAGILIIPNVILLDHTFILLYSSNTEGTYKAALGLAFSDDGIHWERYLKNPIYDFKDMGFTNAALVSAYWEPRRGLIKEVIGILRVKTSGIFSIYSCDMPLLLK